ncbi:GxxExxY protein [Sphingopyxis sp. MWB1]|uniref:GxxExxY protein n=1 Tax=Sphingopyxis sp. MWB1 TaxID=1537715 RepID=UPI00051A04B2|nr:GxxExxY protein [Sphingopyxis sp. MWB1]
MDVEELARITLDCGYNLHREIGPGLLETVYEILLEEFLIERGLRVERQKIVPIMFRGRPLDEAFRVDLLLEGRLVIELKSTERHAPVHANQLLTYLRLMGLPLGLLMNFGAPSFKEGVKRLANNYYRPLAS